MDVSNKEVKRPELYPIQGGSISRGLIKFIKSKGYYRIQSMVDRNNEYYLDSSGNYSVFKTIIANYGKYAFLKITHPTLC